jgi:hypothetical protein
MNLLEVKIFEVFFLSNKTFAQHQSIVGENEYNGVEFFAIVKPT